MFRYSSCQDRSNLDAFNAKERGLYFATYVALLIIGLVRHALAAQVQPNQQFISAIALGFPPIAVYGLFFLTRRRLELLGTDSVFLATGRWKLVHGAAICLLLANGLNAFMQLRQITVESPDVNALEGLFLGVNWHLAYLFFRQSALICSLHVALMVALVILEELFFRKAYFRVLPCHTYWQYAICGLVFAIPHYVQDGNPLTAFWAFCLGSVNAGLYDTSRSIIAPSLCHLAINVFSLLVSFSYYGAILASFGYR